MKKLLILLFLSLGFIGSASGGEVDKNIKKLIKTSTCKGCNLQGADLSGVNLEGAYLVLANLSDANLAGANLTNANLTGANLAEVILTGAVLCNTQTPWGIDYSGC